MSPTEARTPPAHGLLAARLRPADGSLALVPYLMAGHPDHSASCEIARRTAGSGVAAVELGIPHSDPLADGPVIQRAGHRALAAGATVESCLEVAAGVAAEGDAPALLMSYLNPLLAYGLDRFARDAAEVGVAGVVLPDAPVDDWERLTEPFRRHGLDAVPLVAPTSTTERIAAACRVASGFVYCVSVTGVTGSRNALPLGLLGLVEQVREHTTLPVAAGFGVSTRAHVAWLRGRTDAAVVGSALVAAVDQGEDVVLHVKELLTACR